jgi:ribonuclease-3
LKNLRFYAALVQMLGFFPRHLSLYREAFRPKSVVRVSGPGATTHNERLEYLGDAILDAIVADYLFTTYPKGDEGFMSQVRARIVKRKKLDSLAELIGIPALVPSMEAHRAKHLYGNVLEALIGAIYLDRGYRSSRRFFIHRILTRHVDVEKLVRKDPDYKSRVIEWAQKNRIELSFHTLEEPGMKGSPPHFISTLLLKEEMVGSGSGSSKKEAEQRAAREALSHIQQG